MTNSTVMIHETAIVDDDVTIEAGVKVWHFAHILPHTTVGSGSVLGQNVMVGPDVNIGPGCKVQNNVAIYKGVTLEKDVFCGPSCVFTNVLTPRAFVERKDEFCKTLVREGATIGANATIICGITLGRFSMIAAGAVVTKNVPDYALMAGVPAKQIGWVSRTGEVLGESLTCQRTGERYEEKAGELMLLEE